MKFAKIEFTKKIHDFGSIKQGDKVTIKQAIGTIRDEDGKTSMNLQIWKGQKTTDPSGWLFNAR